MDHKFQLSFPYEEPLNPEAVCETDKETLRESAAQGY